MDAEGFRQAHWLRTVKGGPLPTKLIVLDSETYPRTHATLPRAQAHTLRLWQAAYCRLDGARVQSTERWGGTGLYEFWNLVKDYCRGSRPVWVVSHNLGFDSVTTGLWDLVAAEEIEFVQPAIPAESSPSGKAKRGWRGFACIEDPPTILKFRFRGTRKTVIAVDSLNWLRLPLAAIGESLGFSKLPQPPWDAPDEVWVDYCWRDVEVLSKAVLALIKLVADDALGGLCYTTPGQAMRAYRARFMQPESILVHGNKAATTLERASYYGGLSQCWYQGEVIDRERWQLGSWEDEDGPRPQRCGPVTVLDCTSFYLSIMHDHHFPAVLKRLTHKPEAAQLAELLANYICVAHVRVDCDGIGYPVRRKRREFLDSIISGHQIPCSAELEHDQTAYAVGRFWTVLCGPELVRAVDSGHVASVGWLAAYSGAPLFREWAQYVWEQRRAAQRQGNGALALLWKTMGNALFGKFAQKTGSWQEVPGMVGAVPLEQWIGIKPDWPGPVKYRAIGRLVQVEAERVEHTESMPAISAVVCAHGRERIRELRQLAGAANCLYSDTDSLHLLQPGVDALRKAGKIGSGGLGELRIETVAETAAYRGPKDYTVGSKEVLAGMKRKARKFSADTWEQEDFGKLWSTLRGSELHTVIVRSVVKTRHGWTVIGRVQPDGTVLPVTIHD